MDQLPFAEISFTEPTKESLTSNLDVNTEQHLKDADIWADFNIRGFRFLHINIYSLLFKIDELRQIVQETNAAVIGISETKPDDTVLDGEVGIDGYEIKRSDRNRHS